MVFDFSFNSNQTDSRPWNSRSLPSFTRYVVTDVCNNSTVIICLPVFAEGMLIVYEFNIIIISGWGQPDLTQCNNIKVGQLHLNLVNFIQ